MRPLGFLACVAVTILLAIPEPATAQDRPQTTTDLPLRVQELTLRVQDLTLRVQELTPRVQDLPLRVQELTPTVQDQHEHVDVNAPMLTPTREAAGTSWLPDVAPMFGLHSPVHGWDVRLTGIVFVQGVFEPGDRHRTGGTASAQASVINSVMFMARRPLGTARFGLRSMFSLEPWTVRDCGALSFLATGDVCDDDTIHDRQQPQDLVMELAVDYERPLRGEWRWSTYAALAGEPALGTAGSRHRASSIVNPLAPISEHWLEAPHSTFGVVTLGVRNRRWKAEASVFNGRDPDEGRADLDLGAFDSVSGRLSFLPNERWALQVSGGRVRDAKTDFPFAGQPAATKVTASAAYYQPVADAAFWAHTFAVGMDIRRERLAGGRNDFTTAAALVESSFTRWNRDTVFGRAELTGIPGHHLHALEFEASVFEVAKLQLGYVRYLPTLKGLTPGFGGGAAISLMPSKLSSRYSGRTAPSFSLCFSLQPARHQM